MHSGDTGCTHHRSYSPAHACAQKIREVGAQGFVFLYSTVLATALPLTHSVRWEHLSSLNQNLWQDSYRKYPPATCVQTRTGPRYSTDTVCCVGLFVSEAWIFHSFCLFILNCSSSFLVDVLQSTLSHSYMSQTAKPLEHDYVLASEFIEPFGLCRVSKTCCVILALFLPLLIYVFTHHLSLHVSCNKSELPNLDQLIKQHPVEGKNLGNI